VRNIAEVTTAVANGDLSKKITVDVKGEILELKKYHQHDGGSVEFIRIGSNARGRAEVGTEGKLGGQADVQGASRVFGRI